MNMRATGGFQRSGKAGFTLIELLTVMAIILVLAGLVLGLSGLINTKAGRARAQGEIAAMSSACESYRSDNGGYPETTNTDQLIAQRNTDPTATASPTYAAASLDLYRALSGDTSPNADGSQITSKVYYRFTPSQLLPPQTGQSTTIGGIADPFGLSYGYSTAALYAASQASASPSPSASASPSGYNPTFDLWSTASYSNPSTYAAKNVPTGSESTVWVTNWSGGGG